MRISDWSSDVCSSDLANEGGRSVYDNAGTTRRRGAEFSVSGEISPRWHYAAAYTFLDARYASDFVVCAQAPCGAGDLLIEDGHHIPGLRSEEHTSELQSLLCISYAVFCLKKNNTITKHNTLHIQLQT